MDFENLCAARGGAVRGDLHFCQGIVWAASHPFSTMNHSGGLPAGLSGQLPLHSLLRCADRSLSPGSGPSEPLTYAFVASQHSINNDCDMSFSQLQLKMKSLVW
jgi:hypothetical protein